MNTSKRSITLNLDTEDGRRIFGRLASTVDVIAVSGDAARVRALAIDSLLSANEKLIVSAVTPFGLTGPFQDWKGNDFIGWATGGLMFSTGDPDRPPVSPAPVAELSHVYASYLIAFSTLAAVRQLNRGGRGQLVEVSLQQAVATASGESGVSAFIDNQELRTRNGNKRPLSAPFGHYPTTDGFAAVLALMPAHWDALAAWINEKTGEEGVLDESLRGPAFARSGDVRDIADFFTTQLTSLYSKQELFEEGQRRGISITPVNDPATSARDPQLAYRNYWSQLEIAGKQITSPGAPARHSTIAWSTGPAPAVGQHNAEVYAHVGIDDAALERLANLGVV